MRKILQHFRPGLARPDPGPRTGLDHDLVTRLVAIKIALGEAKRKRRRNIEVQQIGKPVLFPRHDLGKDGITPSVW